jgi:hypothetical protein
MKKVIGLIMIMMCAAGCSYFQHKYQSGAVVEVNGNYLYEQDLQHLTAGLSSEDSARVREQFIRQWAGDILLYDEAKDRTDKHIEALVEDYRRSLYVHAYEEKLISRRMPKMIEDTLIEQFYETHKDRFILPTSIVRGILLVVPNGAPDIKKIEKVLTTPDETRLEEIEKFAYKYATGYELFMDQWKSANQLTMRMPFEKNGFERELRAHSQIVLEDSLSTYILQVTDKRLSGDYMPLDYARSEIEKVLLNQRRHDFLQAERDRRYDEAVKEGKVKEVK